jgi:uncharacterized protein YheU (UPF0270 family)
MGGAWVTGGHRFRQVAAMAVAMPAVVLAGGGVAAAAQRHGQAHPRDLGAAVAGTISTLAGGVGGPGPGTKVALSSPCGVATSASNVYISSAGAVRRVTQQTGYLSTLAGTGAAGPLGTGGPATRASIEPCGLAVDRAGNVVVADTVNDLIRVVAHRSGTFYGQAMTAGDIYTVAGGGTGGNGGPATSATLGSPRAVAVDDHGNLLIADTESNEIQAVARRSGTYYGRKMRPGYIYDVAGNGINGYSGDGGAATSAMLSQPAGVSVDAAGNVLIADSANNRIRVVAESTGTFYGQAMKAGDIYTVAGTGQGSYSGDGGPATQAALQLPCDVLADGAGNLVIADTDNLRIRVVAESTGTFYGQAMTAGDIYTVAGTGKYGFFGNGIPATSAGVALPQAVALDPAGNLLITNSKQNRVQVVAISDGTFYGQAMTAGDIYTVAGTGTLGFSGDFGPAKSAEMFNPWGVTTDHAGDVLLSSYSDVVQVVPAANGTLYGHAVKAGTIYAVAGDGQVGFAGDGGPATKAKLGLPVGISTDAAGDLLIPDRLNERIRMVPAASGTYFGQPMTAGDIYTVAGDGTQGYAGDGGPATSAELNTPRAVTVDAAGNLVIADDQNDVIRVVAASTGTFYGQAMTAGDIYTVAGDGVAGYTGNGGPAISAELNEPGATAVDGAGNLVIADGGNNVVRVVAASTGTFYGQAMTAGDIYTIAGDGVRGYGGDGGPATSAELANPASVGVDSAGNLVMADDGNNRIRVVAATSGTFYGQAMTADDIYTVAGDGTAGYAGDGGPATSAELDSPPCVAVYGTKLLIADKLNNRIRVVSG